MSAVPDAWKMAIVTPVFKKGLATDVANYRPISLTCVGVASKIMERIIVDQMTVTSTSLPLYWLHTMSL